MDKAKSRYALETDLEIIIGKEKQSQSEAKNRTRAGWLMLEYSKRGRTATDGSVLGDPNYAVIAKIQVSRSLADV